MCAVRQYETGRRRLLCLLLGFMAVMSLSATTVPPMFTDDLVHDSCQAAYVEQSSSASSNYSLSYDICELTANETKIELAIDEELERKQIELGASTLCGNLALCATLEHDMDYFECIANNGSTNLDLLTDIRFNATSAHTRLRDDYDDVQRTFVLCTIEAQRVYVNTMRRAYEELIQCYSDYD